MNNPNLNLKQMIVPLDQYDDKLIICFYGYLYRYNDLIVINLDTNETKTYSSVSDYLYFDDYFGAFIYQLTIDAPGTYSLCASSSDKTRMSAATRIVVTLDSRKETYHNLISQIFTNDTAKSLYLNYENDLAPNSDLLKYFFNLYKEEENKNKKRAIAVLLNKIVNFYNYRSNLYNVMSEHITVDDTDKSFSLPHEVNSIIRISLYQDDNEFIKRENLFGAGNISLQTNRERFYLYKFLNNDNNLIGIRYYFEPSLDDYNYFKESNISNQETYSRAIERTIQYPSSYLSFSDEELEYLPVMNLLESDIPAIKHPKITIDNNSLFVEVNDYDLMVASNRSFYLTILETELATNLSSRRRIQITSQNFSFTPARYMMLKESFLTWIEDETGKIVSNIKVLHLDYDKSEYESTQARTDDINERIRQLRLYEYRLHLYPYLQNYYPETSQTITDFFKGCESDQDTEAPDLYRAILKNAVTAQNIKRALPSIRLMEEDRTIYGDYLKDFGFEESWGFKYKEDTVVVPPRENTLCIIEKYSLYTEPIIEYKLLPIGKALEYRFYNCQYAVIKCLDLDSFKFSGFLLVDLSKNDLVPRFYKYLIEAEARR